MRYVLKDENGYVSQMQWIAIYVPSSLKYTDDINNAMVFKESFLNLFEEKIGKTRLEIITERFPNIELKAVSIVLNPKR